MIESLAARSGRAPRRAGQDPGAPAGHAATPPASSPSRSPPAFWSASARPRPTGSSALLAIADAHRRHGHVQEVIVQNFLPKPGTAMRESPPCPPEDHLRAIALARLILPADVHVQAPPNLTDEAQLGALLAAGIDDWGGVSPVTADHVNPERPWPALRRAARGHRGRRAHAGAPADRLPGVRARPGPLARSADPLPGARPLRRAGPGRDDAGRGLAGAARRGGERRHRRRGGADRPALDRLVLRCRRGARRCWCPGRACAGGRVARCSTAPGPGRSWARRRSSRCSARAGPRWRRRRAGRRAARRAGGRRGHLRASTGTSTTPTCAPSGARSAGSPRARCR